MLKFAFASRTGAATVASLIAMAGIQAADAADLPAIKISAANSVPACVTPGRLQAYLSKRNPSLDPHFATIAVDYMREGTALGIRWDVAFFQMMLETGSLSYAKESRIAGVKHDQNNFAGLKPIGKNSYESFSDVASGVRAHLQHVTLYAGATVASPVAQRTRRIQEMGLLSQWRTTIKHDVTFTDLSDKWTDGSDTYADRLGEIAEKFTAEHCNRPDPQPELVAVAGGTTTVAALEPAPQPTASQQSASLAADKVSGAELARRAIEQGPDQRSGLGVGTGAAMPVKILNAPQAEAAVTEVPVAAAEPDTPAQATKLPVPQLPSRLKPSAQPVVTKTAAVGAAAKAIPAVEPPAAAPPAQKAPPAQQATVTPPPAPPAPPASVATTAQKCRVFTASYGGQRAVIVRAVVDQVANFTVLDVNDGQEAREAEAFISAYAKGGSVAGQFPSQDKALEKAFELCPEG